MLDSAKTFVERLRFSGDIDLHDIGREDQISAIIHSRLSMNGMVVTPEVIPKADQAVTRAATNLGIERACVSAYVEPSPYYQASCYIGSEIECIISISARAVECLSIDELTFVLGHEIGHFLYGHAGCRNAAGKEDSSTESFILQRSAEISSDRCGLIACGTLDHAIKAIMKISSGLSDEYLRFDVARFVGEIGKLRESNFASLQTHPPLIVRCRALLWFSLSQEYTGDSQAKDLKKIDARISRELREYVDGPAYELIEALKSQCNLWGAACAVVNKGQLSSYDQELLKEILPDNEVASLVKMLENRPINELEDLVKGKLKLALSDLACEIPNRWWFEMEDIVKDIESTFGQKGVFDQFFKFK